MPLLRRNLNKGIFLIMSSVHKIKNLNKESNIYYHANSDMFNLLVELIENNWQSFS